MRCEFRQFARQQATCWADAYFIFLTLYLQINIRALVSQIRCDTADLRVAVFKSSGRSYPPQWVYVRANIKTDLSTLDALFIL